MTAGLGDASIVRLAQELGLDLVGVADPGASPHMEALRSWLAAGHHGEMEYLARPDAVRRRASLEETLPEVRSVIVAGQCYPGAAEAEDSARPDRAVVARYARGRDYHTVLGERLEALLAHLDAHTEDGVRGRVYVDTGPILERDLARRAGLGWFGRNTMLIDPKRGSYFVIGVILVDLDIPRSEPFEPDHCGTCHSCVDACPTGALLGRDADGAPIMDARRCISYLTIEQRGAIPRALRAPMGNRVFGCDICQEVCPWNVRFAPAHGEPAYEPTAELANPDLVQLTDRILAMSEKGYQRAFADSPLARPRRRGMLRNLCVALGNLAAEDPPVEPRTLDTLSRALEDAQPLVRAHAAWALGRARDARARHALEGRAEVETDPEVREEIEYALQGE
jgi:epoxyqueuosine reductase